jgi:MFS family permease
MFPHDDHDVDPAGLMGGCRNFAPVMRDFGIADVAISGMAALPFALTLQRIANGLTRPFFGWVSDNIGREWTMFIAFLDGSAGCLVMLATRNDPLLFAIMSGIVFFGWGEIFSLFPSTLTDTFGTEARDDEFRLFVYRARRGLGVGRTCRRLDARCISELVSGVLS